MEKNPACLHRDHFQARTLEEWRQVAEVLGYETISDMLYIMYEEERMSLKQISRLIGFDYKAIRIKAGLLGVEIRPRGGNNNPTGRTARKKNGPPVGNPAGSAK